MGVGLTHDARGDTTYDGAAGYGYDGLDRLTSAQGVGLGYDALGRLSGAGRARFLYDGTDLIAEYDASGALVRRYVHGPGVDEPLVAYDGAGTGSRRWLLADERGSVIGSADAAGSVASTAFDDDGQGAPVSRFAAGRRGSLTWPDGFALGYQWDDAGKLSALVEGGSAVVTFGYEGRDRRSVLNRANGAQTLYGYDGGGRLSSYAFRLAGSAGEGFTLQRNAAGQVTSRAGDTGAWEASGPAQAAGGFQADALNRIATVDGVALAYDGQSNTARDASGRSFGYDAAGELTAANGVALSYDGLGRLVGEGQRRFVYDGNDLVAEYGADGSLSARYVHGPGEDEPLVAHDGSGAAHHLLADASGSLVGVTGPGGGLEARTAYDDYGRGAPVSRFGFAGKPWLSGAGVYHWRARAYAPDLGRFLQPDPAGYADGLNLYAYVGNDPVNGSDPSGLGCGLGDTHVLASGALDPCKITPAPEIEVKARGGGRPAGFIPALLLSSGSGPGEASGNMGEGAEEPQNDNTKICAGSARGLAGNKRLYGKMGAFATVRPNTAAIIPYQFGASRKAALRPYVGSISGRLTGVVGGRVVTSTFTSITDVIDGKSPIPGVPVRDALQQLFPDQLIIEITGGVDVGANAAFVLKNYPATLPCPTGTTKK